MDQPIKKNIKGIDVYYIKSDKFKTITWSFVFVHPSGTNHINEYYFLSDILVDNMKKYPTFVKKYRYLSSLYGLDAFSSATTIGANIVNQFVVTYPNEIYIKGEDSLSEKAFIFLNEIITDPKMREGKLTRKVYQDSIDEAKQSFNILKSDKDMFAYYQFAKEYYSDKPNLQYNFPDNDRLKEVTLDSLTKVYFDLLDQNRVSLFVTGKFDESKFDEIIQTHLSKQIQSQPIPVENRIYPTKKIKAPKMVRETSNVKQARIYIGYETDIEYYSDMHPAMSVFNDIFGGFDQSILFMDIRERSNLAYFVYSHYIPDEQTIVVPVLTDFDHEEEVIEKVKSGLKQIQNGEFSDALFQQAKNNALTSLYSIYDSQPIYLMQHIKTYHLQNRRYNLEERIKLYESITKEDVIQAANSLVLDTIYVMTKGGEANG
ncbi:MAG: insulinase family protein [Bacilli bacterium]|nr:insulinase family protein [Bacilli bacterium]MBN2877111.1 insulinase family protein [Bacilli bacterium]